jgi:hypothetical protein
MPQFEEIVKLEVMKSQKFKRKVLYYTLKPFNTSIIIVVDKTVGDAINFLKGDCEAKIDVNSEDLIAYGIVGHGLDAEGLKSWYIVFEREHLNLGILAHECFHAIHHISTDKGLFITMDSDEFFAYALEDMVNTLYKEIGI